MIGAGALAIVLIAAQAPNTVKARVAIVIGHNGGAPDPRPALSFADDDAARLYKSIAPSTVKSYLLTTFDHESALVYPELTEVARAPSKEALATVLGEAYWVLRQNKADGKDTELVFAFAGHGDVSDSGEGFVVLADGPFTRSDLESQVIAGSPADTNHVIVDACASYFMVSARGGAPAQSESKKLSPEMLDALRGSGNLDAAARARTGVIVSTSNAAEVHESGDLASGIFSFLLRSALAGAADSNGDGAVEYGEAAAFIASASSGLDDPRARLTVHAEPPLQRPHVALTSLKESGAQQFLAIDREGPVHVRILDSHGAPYAEFFVEGRGRDKPLLLALVGNPFYIVEEGAREAVLVPRSAGAYALSALTFQKAARARGAGSPRFRGLFASKYDESFMRGFVASKHLAPPIDDDAAAIAVAYAEAGAPPTHIPVDLIALGTLAIGGAFAAGAGVSVVGNLVAYDALQRDFVENKVIDDEKALAVEGWRTAATVTAVGAGTFAFAGGALYLWSLSLADGALEVPQ